MKITNGMALGSITNHLLASISTLWLDIEGSQYWRLGRAGNFAFFRELIAECERLSLSYGVYTSVVQWNALFGNARLSNAHKIPLWYPHYDGIPDFNDFRSFGGWTKPTIKQFSDQGRKCGVGYDINWRPHP